ncbi:peptidase [Geomonas limicola]|uniref:Peptidase n=1 Tax=Geomonas limicola TaxID=2740186 RepID=A0A6V8N6T6_9BACT|nr:right-handed parallel beta-helix repeat-containing protein [Geomonas limicola]GFO68191.1 peptidase [Geomonas limicola]
MFPVRPITILALIWFTLLPQFAAAGPADFFVAPGGDDRAPGTLERPFQTLEGARDAIREARRTGTLAGPVQVLVRGGTYHLARTFELSEVDSGSPGAPVNYRPYHNEKVRLTGGREIPGFTPVVDPATRDRLPAQARGKVLQADLRALGIRDFGEMKPRGFGRANIPAGLELFYDGRPMQLARWPNQDWARVAAASGALGATRIGYEGDRPRRWLDAEDLWLHGYWAWDWADGYVRVLNIKPESHELVLREPHDFGYQKKARYRALNLLEELDEQGEWYLDRKKGLIYFWPPAAKGNQEASVSLLTTVVSLFRVSHLNFEGFTIECCRGSAVVVNGGSNTRCSRLTVRNAGNTGVRIEGGSHNGVEKSEISHCGEGGIFLSGGDRQTLTAGGNYALDNRIHDIGRWVRTYTPGIDLYGVGNRVAHNLIYDAPHTAILLHGNDHLVEYNEIHHVCLETSDAGAFYMGRDYSERGNVLRFNYFHDLNLGDVQAIYLDDFASGTTVFGNLVYRAGRALQVGGGRDNQIENNIFIDCREPSFFDARGTSWYRKYFDGTDTTLTARLAAVRYREPPYSTRYPQLPRLYEKDPARPEGNRFVRNISVGGGLVELKEGVTREMVHLADNLENRDPGFVDRRAGNFQLKKGSPAFKLGFKRIPLERIGPRVDAAGK